MKTKSLLPLSLLSALGIAVPLSAADLIKADNSTALNTAGSYTDPLATPSNADWVVFDDTFATTTDTIVVGGASMRGLRIINPGNDVTLTLGNSTSSIGVNNSVGGSIDLSSATRNLTVNSSGSFGALRMYGAASTISVAEGRVLTVNAPVFVYHSGGGSLTISGGGAVNLNGVVRNGDTGTRTTRIVHAGTGVLTLGGANTYTGGTAVSSGTVAISQDFAMSGVNAIGIDAAAGTHGEITFGGSVLTLGGSLQLDLTGIFPEGGTFDLIDLGAGIAAGGFSEVSIAGSYVAELTNNGAGVWSGVSGDTTFVFNQGSGDLTVSVSSIPEPSAAAVFAGLAGLAAVMVSRRRG